MSAALALLLFPSEIAFCLQVDGDSAPTRSRLSAGMGNKPSRAALPQGPSPDSDDACMALRDAADMGPEACVRAILELGPRVAEVSFRFRAGLCLLISNLPVPALWVALQVLHRDAVRIIFVFLKLHAPQLHAVREGQGLSAAAHWSCSRTRGSYGRRPRSRRRSYRGR